MPKINTYQLYIHLNDVKEYVKVLSKILETDGKTSLSDMKNKHCRQMSKLKELIFGVLSNF